MGAVMRNAKLEAKLIRRQIRQDNKTSMFAGYMDEVNRSALRDPYLNNGSSIKGWTIVGCLVVLCLVCTCAVL